MLKLNKGEWSELYVFIKLLAEARIHFGDEFLNLISDKFFDIDAVIKTEKGIDQVYFIKKDAVEIDSAIISRLYLKQLSKEVFDQILLGRSTFEINKSEDIKKSLLLQRFSQPSANKVDLKLSLVNLLIDQSNVYGFSIKTKFAGKSTLVNASGKNTGFKYEITNFNSALVSKVNAIEVGGKINKRVSKIIELGGNIKFLGPTSEIYKSNLKMVDSHMDKIIGELLLCAYIENQKTLKKAINSNRFKTFCAEIELENQDNVIYKIKNFLNVSALGLTTGSKWDGTNEVDGGFIIVKLTGELVGYFLFSLDKFKDYLWNNTYFETPSTTRHKFGFVYEENEHFYFDLNLQVRFT